MAATDAEVTQSEILDHVADGVYFVDAQRRITSWNKSAQRITGFSSEEVRGRCCGDCILTHVDDQGVSLCKGQCPLSHTLKDGERREAVVNLHHKAGHRVPVHIDVSPVRNADGRIVGAVETFRECSDVIALRSSIERLKQWGCVDIESGLPNRRIAEWQLLQRAHEMQRFGWNFCVMLVEIDFLKELRARWGDEGTEQAIRMAAMGVQNALRSVDMVARWDESTFIGIVANTSRRELPGICERVRMFVDTAYRRTGDGELHATVSIGAVGAEPGDNAESVVRKAARSLYASRTAGRNRVTIAADPG